MHESAVFDILFTGLDVDQYKFPKQQQIHKSSINNIKQTNLLAHTYLMLYIKYTIKKKNEKLKK